MKAILSVALLVGLALARPEDSPSSRHPNQFHYKLESQILTGIPNIKGNQKSGFKLSADVFVGRDGPEALKIKILSPKFLSVNNEHLPTNGDRVIVGQGSAQEEELPAEFVRQLTSTFDATIRQGSDSSGNGAIVSIVVGEGESADVVNIKRSVASQLQMDVDVIAQTQLKSSSKPPQFSTMETNINGVCKTHYTVTPLSKENSDAFERELQAEEEALKQQGMGDSGNSNTKGKELCQGLQYFEVVKTKDFDDCRFRPVFQTSVGIKTNCPMSRGQCDDLMANMNTARSIVCASNDFYVVRKSQTQSELVTNPLGWNHTPEKMITSSSVSLTLQGRGNQRLEKVQGSTQEKGLVFEYETGKSSKNQQQIIEEALRNGSDIPAIRPFPDLTSPSNILPPRVRPQELKELFLAQLRRIADIMHISPKSCASKEDIAGSLVTLAKALRPLGLNDLRQLESEISQEFGGNDQRAQKIKELFGDLESMTGTNPALSHLHEKIKNTRQSEKTLTRQLQAIIRHSMTPSEEFMEKALNMIEELRSSHPKASNAGLLALANLAYDACIDETSKQTSFPARIYGEFCSEQSRFFTVKLMPYLSRRLQYTDTEENLLIVAAMGKTGHPLALQPLISVIESEQQSKLSRSLAVHSLKRLAKRRPTHVRQILLALATNVGESAEVRMAAIAVLPWTQPSVSDFQRLVARSWAGEESSKQVASFLVSTMESLAATEVPELVEDVAVRAKTVLDLFKRIQGGAEYAHNSNSGHFVQYLLSAANGKLVYSPNRCEAIPGSIAMDNRLYGPFWEMKGPSFAAYMQGMDKVWQDFFNSVTGGSFYWSSPQVQEMLKTLNSKLGINNQSSDDNAAPKAFFQFGAFGFERMAAIEPASVYETLTSSAKSLMEKVLSPASLSLQKEFDSSMIIDLVDFEGVMPTENGFSLHIGHSAPVAAAARGNINGQRTTDRKSGLLPSAQGSLSMQAALNFKIDATVGVKSPFKQTKTGSQVVNGAGVQVSTHLAAPVELSLKLGGGNLEVAVQSARQDEGKSDVHLMHYFVQPFTYRQEMKSLLPISKSSQKIPINSGKQIKPINIPVGKSLGISSELSVVSDSELPYDLGTLASRYAQHSLYSMFALSSMAPRARATSIKLNVNPANSATKRVATTFRYVASFPQETSSPMHSLAMAESQIGMRCIDSPTPGKCWQHMVKEMNHEKTRVQALHSKAGPKSAVVGVSMQASLTDSNGNTNNNADTISSLLLVSAKSQEGASGNGGQKSQTFVDFTLRGGEGRELYSSETEVDVTTPEMPYRWDVNSLIEQDLSLQINGKSVYGPPGAKEQVKVEGQLMKTPEQKTSIRNSPEFGRCRLEVMHGRSLSSSICEEVRHQAASVDKIVAKATLPKRLIQSSGAQMLKFALEQLFFGQVVKATGNGNNDYGSSSRTFDFSLRFSRTGDVANAVVTSTSGERTEVKNIRVPQPSMFPLSLRNGVMARLEQKATRDQSPASCRVDEEAISTFDNVTYDFRINDCEYLAFKDCSNSHPELPVAVTVRRVSQSRINVKVLSNEDVLELQWSKPRQLGGAVYILLNGAEIELKAETTRKVKDIVLHRFKDGVVRAEVGLVTAFYDGWKLEVMTPRFMVKDKSCGLCGDNNGESSADVRTSRGCVYSKPQLAAYSYILNKGQCSGVPQEDQEAYENETGCCDKRSETKTQMGSLKHWPYFAQTGGRIVEVDLNRICISLEASKVCPNNGVPTEAKLESMGFVCLPRPSAKAALWARLAEAGEVIDQIDGMKPSYQQKVLVPTKCAGEA